MEDNLFLMQRYWGSDEDSNECSFEGKESINVEESSVNEKNVEPKRKKQKRSEQCEEISVFQKRFDEKSEFQESEILSNNAIFMKGESLDVGFSQTSNLESKKGKEDISNGLGSEVKTEVVTEKVKKKKKKKLKQARGNESTNDNKPHVKKSDTENNFRTIGQVKDRNVTKMQPSLPEWLKNPTIIGIDLHEQEIAISDLSYLDDISRNNLKNAEINFLFPVQLAVIPWLLNSDKMSLLVRPCDICVSAPTGSGKTLAFVLPIVQSLRNRVVCAIRAVIVLPVSELAIQVHKVFEKFIRGTDLKVVLLTGQKSFQAEQHLLVKKSIFKHLCMADIVVTTPGRILDHVNRTEGFSLQKLRYLVIDEADRLMDDIQKGWLKQIEDAVYLKKDASSCPCFSLTGGRMSTALNTACSYSNMHQPLQKLLYSATLSHNPEKLHTLSLYKPKLFASGGNLGEVGKCPVPTNLENRYIVCKAGTKPLVLTHFILENCFKKVLCFTDSIERAQRLNFVLSDMGFLQSREISSNNRPVQRKIILEQFSSGKVDILVCSDLVARGIDIEEVDCVVSYDVPPHVKMYIHRIGRTARAGKSGTSVTLVTEGEVLHFKKLLNSASIPFPELIALPNQDLEKYVAPFQTALVTADTKVKKLKNEKKKCFERNMPKKNFLRKKKV